jgi:hypothetical protein
VQVTLNLSSGKKSLKENILTTSKKNTGRRTIKAKKQNLQSLSELYHAHRGKVSDKWNSYLRMYDKRFDEVRQKRVSIFEIGVQNGGSLEIWRKYFRNAKFIVGCDINEKCKDLRFKNKEISVVVGDANSDTMEQHVINTCPAFDIIIDDGSHKSSDIVRSFSRYFKYLNHDGFYIIEDLHCSYWEEYEGGLYAPYSAMAFFKQLVDVLNYEHWGLHTGRTNLIQHILEQYGCSIDEALLKQIHTIEFNNSLCLIRKAKNTNNLEERIVVGDEQSVFPNRHLAGTRSTSPSEVNNRWIVSGLPPQVQFFQQKQQIQQDRTQLQEQIANLIQNNEELQKIGTMARTELLRISNNMHKTRTWRDNGWSWLRARISPEKAKLITLRASVFFDADWYLATYPDVAEGNMDPARHYLDFGAEEGRDPGPFFSTLGYFTNNPESGINGVNPLLHYEGFGSFSRNSDSVSILGTK